MMAVLRMDPERREAIVVFPADEPPVRIDVRE